jgi:uncharacterized protein involved in outer membrane biogenesis
MQRRFYTSRGFRAGTIIFGLVLALCIVALATADLAPIIANRISSALDKPVTIASAKLKLSFRPRIAMEDVKIGQVANGRADFADAQSMRVSIDLWEFITGDLVLPEVQLVNARLNLTRDANGNVNWSSDKKPADRADPDLPQIETLNVKDTVVTYRDEMTATNLKLNVETQEPLNGKEPTLRVRGEGTYQNRAAKLDMRGGSILKLRDNTSPYPVNGTFSAGNTEVSIAGTITDPTRLTGLNIKLEVKGQNADELFPLFGVAIFPTPPYTLTTKLDRDGEKWVLTDMTSVFGETDIAGKLTWDVSGKKPRLDGTLHSKSLKLRDMAGFIGAAPGDIETPIEIRTKAADREKERRIEMGQGDVKVANVLLFPDRPMSLEKLNSMNAKVKLTADTVVTKGFPIDRLSVDLVLDDGVLKLKPLDFNVEDGRLGFDITVNSQAKPIKTDVNIAVERFPIRRLLGKVDKSLEENGTSWGAIGGRIELHGTGDSMHKIMATSDGDVALLAEDGQISLLLVELMDLDIAESLGLLLTKDRPIGIRCMAVDMSVQQGLMTSRNFVIDTQDSAIIGSGTADLGREVFDLKLNPKPKDNSIAAIRAPILITGSFSNPYVGPDMGVVTARGGAAVALGLVLTPFAALLPLIEIGTGKDMNCAQLIKSTEQTAQSTTKKK